MPSGGKKFVNILIICQQNRRLTVIFLIMGRPVDLGGGAMGFSPQANFFLHSSKNKLFFSVRTKNNFFIST